MTVKANNQQLIPPDGGWGWMVVLGASIVNLSTRSIEPSFGLLFGDLLKELDVATTGASIIMATLDAMINFSGLFVGPLIKKYSYRKVGIVGGVLSALALLSTSAADSIYYILATYSIMGGLGFGLSISATFVALNSYFEQKRGQAVGLAMAGTALGFMAMPQLISFLLRVYDFRGAVVILGAVSLNAIVGAMLLQPVEKHMKPAPPEEKELQEFNKELACVPEITEPEATDCLLENQPERKTSTPSLVGFKREPSDGMRRQLSVASALYKQYSPSIQRQWSFIKPANPAQKKSLLSIPQVGSAMSITSRRRKISAISNVSHLDFMGSTMHLEMEDYPEEEEDVGMQMKPGLGIDNKENISPSVGETLYKLWQRINRVMDFDLLNDGVYLNILFGLSITYVAELNFKTIVPFFMDDMGYTKQDTASALSMMAIADIISRVTIPPILDRLPYSRRATLMFSCVFLAIIRSLLAEQTSWVPLIACFVINGFLRGVTLINFPLVISEFATNEKYPAALGLSMVAKGLFIVVLGPLVGLIRDLTGSYPVCIHTQTIMITSCLIAWGIEYGINYNRQKKKKNLAADFDIA